MAIKNNQSTAALAHGQWIREVRRRRYSSVEAAAAAAGIAICTLAQIERTGRISPRSAQALAPVLGVAVKALLGR